MCAKREEEVVTEEEEEGDHHKNVERFEEEQSILEEIQQQNMGINDYSYSNSNTRLMFPSSSEISPIHGLLHHQQLSSSWSTLNQNNPLLQYPITLDPFLFPPPPPPPPPPSFGGLFNRRGSSSDHQLRILSETLGHVGSGPFEMGKMTAQEMMDAKALAASKSHSEAERRRRERINNHLAKLRSLLPNTTKTDKASLLAEVIQHVKELKRQTSMIAEESPVPTEIDELSVASDKLDGKLVIRASLCCDDRSDLLPDLINTFKALGLTTLKADITTLAGRVKNVLFITTADNHHNDHQMLITTIQEALKQVMDKSNAHDLSSATVKRQRTNTIHHP